MEVEYLVLLVMLIMGFQVQGQGRLRNGFYSSSCQKVEDIIRSTVEAHFDKDPTIAAGVLRLHFHDCFVQVLNLWLLVVELFSLFFDVFSETEIRKILKTLGKHLS